MRYPLILLGLLLSLTGCPKKKDPYPELVRVAFVVPARIEPGGDVVALGDTLWLDLDAPDSLLDLRSNSRYRVPGQELPLRSAISFYKLTGPTQPRQGYARGFGVVPGIGRVQQGSGTSVLVEPVYDEVRQRHRARVGMVARERGVFSLTLLTFLPDPYGPERPLPFLAVPPGADGRARRAILDNIYYVLNDGAVHFGLQQQHSPVLSTGPNPSEDAIYYEQKSTFTFMVQ